MNTTTFYPASTECYRDPSQGSCFSFGNSGSGAMRKITVGKEERFAFAGPLSMSKSCDSVYIFDNEISYSSANPGVFTDAYCYLPWIAASYGMKLPDSYTTKDSCGQAKGNRETIDQATCNGKDAETLFRSRCRNWRTSIDAGTGDLLYNTEYECQQDLLLKGSCCGEDPVGPKPLETDEVRLCDFVNHTYTKNGRSMKWDRCMLEAREGYAYNIYMCKVLASRWKILWSTRTKSKLCGF